VNLLKISRSVPIKRSFKFVVFHHFNQFLTRVIFWFLNSLCIFKMKLGFFPKSLLVTFDSFFIFFNEARIVTFSHASYIFIGCKEFNNWNVPCCSTIFELNVLEPLKYSSDLDSQSRVLYFRFELNRWKINIYCIQLIFLRSGEPHNV